MKIKLANLILENPVILASGTFDQTIANIIDLNKLGGLVTKTITLKPRAGNPLPHIIKTKYGFLNSVGLKNPGIEKYLKNELPFWKKFKTRIIPSIGGHTEKEYIELAKILNKNVDTIEVNISCPNVNCGGMAFGQDLKIVKRLITSVRKQFNGNIIVKLTPHVTDIISLTKIALKSGADIISLTNTFLGMEIDHKKKKAKLAKKFGGYSGPAIKPISLQLVWQVYNKLRCPIIGGGGISDFDDALDFIMVGATAISIGSGMYLDRKLPEKIAEKFEKINTNKIKGII
ncbi:MAG: dihydroorotate dehydrogenase [Patescibacteria group bacterium]|nr:dihydroorotate dehydrogenase [Patescibacteria group bacterium]